MRQQHHLVFLLPVWLLSLHLTAQQGSYSFIHYTTEQGLSNDHVTEILKDRQGFLWIGTINGLNRFDGLHFKKFYREPDNPNSLRQNMVQHLTLAPDGSIWISGNRGINRLNPISMTMESVRLPENQDTLPNDQAGKVVFDKKGNAWVSAEKGIYCLNAETRKIIGSWKIPPHAGNFFSFIDKNEQIWLFNNAILHRFDIRSKKLRRFKYLRPGVPFEEAAVIKMAENGNGDIWLTSWSYGLLSYDPVRDTILDHPDHTTLSTGIMADTTSDGKTFFWMGGGKNGLYHYYLEENSIRYFPPDPLDPYSHNNYLAYSFYKDHSTDEVWIGTEAGLELYAPSAIRFGRATLPLEYGLQQFSLVTSAVKDNTDPSGNTYFIGVWINGIFKWDRLRNTMRKLSQKEVPLLSQGIFTLYQDDEGYIWAGTNQSISQFHPKTGETRNWTGFFTHPKEAKNVLCITEDNNGNLWFGTNLEGLFRLNRAKQQIEKIDLPDSIFATPNKHYISSISTDHLGRVWFTTNLLTVRYDPATGELKAIQAEGQFYTPAWSGICVTSAQRVYAVSAGTLLEIDLDGNILQKYTQGNGFLTGQPNQVVEDHQGKIWLNSDYLLHTLDPQTGKFSHYGIADGLFSNAPTDGLILMPDGEIFVGFQHAFNYFNPATLRRNDTPPPVSITSVKVMNKERKPEISKVGKLFNLQSSYTFSKITIHPKETLFSVEFAALNFNQPARNRYAYMLEGFDEDWNYTDRPIATYTNLDGGEYILRLKASNNDGVWNETGASLIIDVIPPLVKRWYFQVFLLMLGGLMLASVWWFRRRQRYRLEAFRESLARDLHDEMGSTLSSIRFFSEFARQQIGEANTQVSSVLQRISASASDLSESMQDIIWAMKTKEDQLADLTTHMTEFGLRMLEARNVLFKMHANDSFRGKQLTLQQRRNIYLIFKEAVNNAAKYAEATQVEVFLGLKKGLLYMQVLDDGKGFKLNPGCTSGNGLINMQKRAEEIGGKLEINTAPGKGTRVQLRVRL